MVTKHSEHCEYTIKNRSLRYNLAYKCENKMRRLILPPNTFPLINYMKFEGVSCLFKLFEAFEHCNNVTVVVKS